ncbi:MAG: hypothetical protein K0S71_1435 [Clostridia bacterium]|jgi:hypothetical protein|nr:hypothetical protein [Clostridia bacterium]
MKKIISAFFMLVFIFSAGCSKKETIDLAPVPDTAQIKEVKEEKGDEVTTEQFTAFFKDYFALTEEDILVLNQNFSKVNEAYWSAHEGYKKRLDKLVKTYFAEEIQQKLNSEYLDGVLHLPKKLAISEYVTYDPQIVEVVDIISVRSLGENKVYEVGVTTQNKVQTIKEANEQYTWDEEKGYYTKEAGNNPFIEENKQTTYLSLQDEADKTADEIKLIQRFWVEVQPNKSLKILSVREASPISVNADVRKKAQNVRHVIRVPYYKEVSAKEQEIIKKVFQIIMSKNRSFYSYYEKAFMSSFETFEEIWKDTMRLDKEVFLTADYYQDAFAPYINPYKDSIYQVNANIKKMLITPSTYSTQKQPRFIVTIPVKAILNNNEAAYYHYRYYIGMEQNKIECIQFMNMDAITEETYLEKTEEDKEAGKDNEQEKEEQKAAELKETAGAEQ